MKNGPVVKINGRALEATAAPGSYLAINRTWKTGDRVEMELPMHLTVEATPDDPTLQAFLYGPLVLAGDFGSAGLTKDMLIGQSAPRIRWPRPNAAAAPAAYENPNAPRTPPLPAVDFTLKAGGKDPASWIKPAGKPFAFEVAGQSRSITLTPINSIFDRRYVVYWQVRS
jgi:hypothetical protein